jgi:hypothetical protein
MLLKNAGADWVDQEAVVDKGLVTSRSPARSKDHDRYPAFKIRNVEVARVIGEYFALLTERIERRKRVLQQIRSAPVQQVAIQPVGLEVGERSRESDLRPQSGAFCGSTLETRNTSSRRPEMALPTSSSVALEIAGASSIVCNQLL